MNSQMFKLDSEKAEEPDQVANIPWIIEKARQFQKNTYFCFIDYDQPRQHIKKQRHYFVNKGPSSQGCGFSSSHVWM